MIFHSKKTFFLHNRISIFNFPISCCPGRRFLATSENHKTLICSQISICLTFRIDTLCTSPFWPWILAEKHSILSLWNHPFQKSHRFKDFSIFCCPFHARSVAFFLCNSWHSIQRICNSWYSIERILEINWQESSIKLLP